MRNASLILLTLVSCLVAPTAFARSPDTFEEDYHRPALIDSPMWWALELKMGPYVPGNGKDKAFNQVFGNDKGWLLSAEVDVTLYHIPYVGQFNVGGMFGWSAYDAKAKAADNSQTSEVTKLTLLPLTALAVLRVDALARYTVVPLTFAGKAGWDFIPWSTETGKTNSAHGFNNGFRWDAQVAFELDFFDRQGARRTDEDWGINHTFLLFDYFQSFSQGTGDRTYQIGLGMQF
jgi:hypothetical protein